MKLSVIVPIYNEEKTLKALVARINSVVLPSTITKEIILVDDGSRDNTKNILIELSQQPELKIFKHDKNQGKTFAVQFGLKQATGDIVLIQDADLEYPPEFYPQLIQPIIDGKSEIVYGSRFMGKIKKMEFINWLANKISVITINLLYQTKMTDFHTGFKVFKRDIILSIPITSKKFSFDTEITCRLLKSGHKILEIPIEYCARSRKEGKKITWATAIETYIVLWKTRFS